MKKPRSRPEKPAKLRCFFGLAYPLTGALGPLIDRLGQLAGDPDTRLRLIDPVNMHITLKFLGSIEEARLTEVSTLARAVCARHPVRERFKAPPPPSAPSGRPRAGRRCGR